MTSGSNFADDVARSDRGWIMTTRHNKPIGLDGSLRHEVGPGVDEATFLRRLEPKSKDAIEADIVAAFGQSVEASEADGPPSFVKLEENDLDFLWTCDGRSAKLELTELVLTTPPYQETGDGARIEYKPWAE